MFVLEVPALLVDGLWPLAVVMFVAGSATAPMLITSLSLAQRLVPRALVTEGMAVAITGILIGISAGSAVGGWAIEAWGAQAAYAVPVVSGGLALALIAARYRHLERAELAARRGAGAGQLSQAPARMTATTSSVVVEVHEVGAAAGLDRARRRSSPSTRPGWRSPPPRRPRGAPRRRSRHTAPRGPSSACCRRWRRSR